MAINLFIMIYFIDNNNAILTLKKKTNVYMYVFSIL